MASCERELEKEAGVDFSNAATTKSDIEWKKAADMAEYKANNYLHMGRYALE